MSGGGTGCSGLLQGLPAIYCGKGCATCCTLRVTATAPEVLMVARFIQALHPALKARCIDLPAQVAVADTQTQGLDELGRVSVRKRCPFIAQGACVKPEKWPPRPST